MKRFYQKHRRLIAVAGISLMAATLLVSCQSPQGIFSNGFTFSSEKVPTTGEETVMKASLSTMPIEHVSADQFDAKVLQSEVPVLVDFYAEWCGPCKALAPVLEEVARETPDAKIVKVNVDESYELADRYHITSIPSLLLFKNSSLAERHVGLVNKAALKSLLTR
jgi:thioredoxin 1